MGSSIIDNNQSLDGESHHNEIWQIHADQEIVKSNLNSLIRIANSNSRNSVDKLTEEITQLILSFNFNEKLYEKIKKREEIILSTFNIAVEREKDEYLRYKYYQNLSFILDFEEDGFEDHPNQIIFKRNLREILWHNLRYKLGKWCGHNKDLLNKVSDRFITFIIQQTKFDNDAKPSEWLSTDKKNSFINRFPTLIKYLEKEFTNADAIEEFHSIEIENSFKDYIGKHPLTWEKELELDKWNKLSDITEYNTKNTEIETLKTTITSLLNERNLNASQISSLFITQNRLDQKRKELNEIKTKFYSRHRFSKKKDAISEKWNEFKDEKDNIFSSKRNYMINELTGDVQNYAGNYFGHVIASWWNEDSKGEFEWKEIALKTFAIAGPLFSTFPSGSLFFSIFNGIIDGSFAKKQEPLIDKIKAELSKIKDHIDKLKDHIDTKFEEYFEKFRSDIRILNIESSSGGTIIAIKNELQETLNKKDQYSSLMPVQIDKAISFFDLEFKKQLANLLNSAYGLTIDLVDQKFDFNDIKSLPKESLINILAQRVKDPKNNYTLYQFYSDYKHITGMLTSLIRLMYYKQSEFKEFIAIAHSAEYQDTAFSIKCRNSLINVLKYQTKSEKELNLSDKIYEFIEDKALQLVFGVISGKSIVDIFEKNQGFHIVASDEENLGKIKYFSKKEMELSCQNIYSPKDITTEHRFVINTEENPYCIRFLGDGSKGACFISAEEIEKTKDKNDKDIEDTNLLCLDKTKRYNNFTIVPTNKNGVFKIHPMKKNVILSNRCIEVINTQAAIRDSNNQNSQLFQLKPVLPTYYHLDTAEKLDTFFDLDKQEDSIENSLLAYFMPGSEIIPNVKYSSKRKKEYLFLNSSTQTFQIINVADNRITYELPVKCDKIVYENNGNLVAYQITVTEKGLKKTIVWESKTKGAINSDLRIESGRLRIKNYIDQILWSSDSYVFDVNKMYTISAKLKEVNEILLTKLSNNMPTSFTDKIYYLEADVNHRKSFHDKNGIYLSKNKKNDLYQKFSFVRIGESGCIYQIVCRYNQSKYILEYTKDDNQPFKLTEKKEPNNKNLFFVTCDNLNETLILPYSEIENAKTMAYYPNIVNENFMKDKIDDYKLKFKDHNLYKKSMSNMIFLEGV